jgi:hypothetical protein
LLIAGEMKNPPIRIEMRLNYPSSRDLRRDSLSAFHFTARRLIRPSFARLARQVDAYRASFHLLSVHFESLLGIVGRGECNEPEASRPSRGPIENNLGFGDLSETRKGVAKRIVVDGPGETADKYFARHQFDPFISLSLSGYNTSRNKHRPTCFEPKTKHGSTTVTMMIRPHHAAK